MKKTAAFVAAIILTLCAAVPTWAQESASNDRPQKIDGWKFAVEPLFGTRLGQCKEIVWRNKSSGGKYLLSELVYDMLPAWYVGANVGARYKRFELNFLSKFFLPSKTGHLEDSDWQNLSDHSMKTDFSRHSLFIKPEDGLPGFELELGAAFNFYPTSFLTLAPLLSFDAHYISFKAKDGTGWYGWYNNPGPKTYPYDDPDHRDVRNYDGENVIDYELYNLFIWTGLRADFVPCSWVKLSLASEVALFWAMVDFDRHLSNHKNFIDITYSAFYAFRQTIKAEFKIKKFFSICQKTSFLVTGESEGDTYIKDSDKYKKNTLSKSGAQLICVDLELSAKFTW